MDIGQIESGQETIALSSRLSDISFEVSSQIETLLSTRIDREVILDIIGELYREKTGKIFTEEERKLLSTKWDEYFQRERKDVRMTDIRLFLREIDILGAESLISNLRDVAGSRLSTLIGRTESVGTGHFREVLSILENHLSSEEVLRAIGTIARIRGNTRDENVTILLESLPEDVRSRVEALIHDPRSQRLLFQDMLTIGVDALARKTGIHIELVTLGGRGHGDGGAIIRIPEKYGKEVKYIVWVRGEMIIATSPEKALDTLSVVQKSPVFIHYLVDTRGAIIGKVDTDLSLWMRQKLFPSESLIREWVKNPHIIPPGMHLDVRIMNTGKKISLTGKTRSGWFIDTGISHESFSGMEVRGNHLTLGWIYESKENRVAFSLSGSRLEFADPSFATIDGRSLGMDAKNTLYHNEGFRLGTSGSGWIGAQANPHNWKKPQTAEIQGKLSIDVDQEISPQTAIGFSFGNNFQWAPNAFPNTFDKISLQERAPSHFLRARTTAFRVSQALDTGGMIRAEISRTQSQILTILEGNIVYSLGGKELFLKKEGRKSLHHFVSSGATWKAGLKGEIFPGVQGYIQGEIRNTGEEEKKKKTLEAGVDIRL